MPSKAIVFYFSIYRPSRPYVLKIEKKDIFFFSILFLYFPPTHSSIVPDFNYVFFVSLLEGAMLKAFQLSKSLPSLITYLCHKSVIINVIAN